MMLMNEFGPQNRLDPRCSCHVEKANCSIQSVSIGDGERVLALCADGLAERLQCGDALHRGIR
jgi:hypothetical protein